MPIIKELCDKAQSSEIVDELFTNYKSEGLSYLSNDKVREMMECIAKKMGKTLKAKIISDAKLRANNSTNLAFGPFYMGMPYIDAILLAEELGISDDMTIYTNCREKGICEIREKASVWRITFGNRAKFKFIDCDDAAALDQVIHQYVKKRSGKVSKLYYNEETRVEDDDMIGVCFGYSNTKLGTKVLFNDDTGKLSLVAL